MIILSFSEIILFNTVYCYSISSFFYFIFFISSIKLLIKKLFIRNLNLTLKKYSIFGLFVPSLIKPFLIFSFHCTHLLCYFLFRFLYHCQAYLQVKVNCLEYLACIIRYFHYKTLIITSDFNLLLKIFSDHSISSLEI